MSEVADYTMEIAIVNIHIIEKPDEEITKNSYAHQCNTLATYQEIGL